jgi:hypothetical protein
MDNSKVKGIQNNFKCQFKMKPNIEYSGKHTIIAMTGILKASQCLEILYASCQHIAMTSNLTFMTAFHCVTFYICKSDRITVTTTKILGYKILIL